jgi:2-iminobutanoate/2-iminopropanoate deaminase
MKTKRSLAWLLALLSLPGCAVPAARREAISTPSAPAAIGPYSQAIRSGDAVWVAGQLGLDPATGKMAEGGIEAETRRALENVRAILASVGLGLGDVVQTQVFLQDLDDFQAMNAVYAGFFPESPPARATVQVARLPRGARVEILAVAVGEGRKH